MVDRTPSLLLVEPGAPQWAQRLGQRLVKTFLNLFPTSPVRLWKVAQADLPDAAEWTGAALFVADLGKLAVSDGVAWTDAIGGPL
jgi:hypothetical protein